MPKATNPLFRRQSTSAIQLQARKRRVAEDTKVEPLDDTGVPPSLAPRGVKQDVVSLIRHVVDHAFEPMPDRAAGMGSERVSEVLRFRQSLPNIVSIAHLQALSTSPTAMERELARLIAMGVVRKTVIPGRGKGGAAVGEGVALVEDWKARLQAEEAPTDELKTKYFALMDANPSSRDIQTINLTQADVRALVHSGFLTSPSALSSNLSTISVAPSIPTLSRHLSAPTGSLAAVGGYAAIQDSGGGSSMLASRDSRPTKTAPGQTMTFALPSTGAYLKLLTAARLHLLALLRTLSPRHKEATWDMLKEKWEGNVGTDAASKGKRERGEWRGVLPGRTRMWREFWGLRFEWVVEECVGSGLVEVFETGSVGWAIRGT